MKKISEHSPQVVVCALYQFVDLPDFEAIKAPLQAQMDEHHLRGTLLLAHEGINGTIAGAQAGIDALLDWLRFSHFDHLSAKFSFHDEIPFHRAKVKLKKEIVTMGVDSIDPQKIVGTYVKPSQWNELIEDPEVTLIDTRNEYEVQIGSFKTAVNPHTTSFREFPDYVKNNLNPVKNKKVAMFCTGGIRCEKSTAYLRQRGFDEVYHLEGGILKYLEDVPPEKSLWQGECFVFDSRVTVNHQLERGKYEQCHGCRMPLTNQEMQDEAFVPGTSCPHCIDKQTPEQRARFQEREKQVKLAKKRGESHIGSDAREAQQEHKRMKQMMKRQQRCSQ
ncbi:MAG: rhodanese-related sulfurtransferase [bacterium]|nr:rhodanese-related sulfurtransferase [Gammaproteobacteria bacterium]HIL95450.1 rhodanese-related sulfurtransferase [Pseudomonadales bacterium]